jgi:hypothetical protein
MLEEGFLRRWARRKSESREGRAPEPERVAPPAVANVPDADAVAAAALAVPTPPPADVSSGAASDPARPLPTMDDVAALGADSDFSAFVARGVDQAVRRSALKKLFADPHFSVMDKLDIYIDDFTKPSPMSEAMLASLGHAKNLFLRAVDEGPETDDHAAAHEQAPTQQPPEQETQ